MWDDGCVPVWNLMSVGCTGCMGVQGTVAREGPQQHSVALPPLWGHWGHGYSSRGAHKSPVGSAGGWGTSSPSLSRTRWQTVTPGDGHTPLADTLLPPTPQHELTAQPQHPNSRSAPCGAGHSTSIATDTRCQHGAGAAALPNQRTARLELGPREHPPVPLEDPDPPVWRQR